MSLFQSPTLKDVIGSVLALEQSSTKPEEPRAREDSHGIATEAGKEMIWLHGFLDELGKKQEMGILHSDSQSAIFLAKN